MRLKGGKGEKIDSRCKKCDHLFYSPNKLINCAHKRLVLIIILHLLFHFFFHRDAVWYRGMLVCIELNYNYRLLDLDFFFIIF